MKQKNISEPLVVQTTVETESKNEEFFDPVDQQGKIKKANKIAKEKKSFWKKTKNFFSKMKFGMKKWFFGLGKEFSRISWISREKIVEDFIIVLVICIFFALIFFGIDMILVSI